MVKLWTSLLCTLLAVSVSVGQQCCNDEIPTDRCDPVSREEIDSSGLQEGDVLSSPCTDISEEYKSYAVKLLAKDKAAKAEVDAAIQLAEQEEFSFVPAFSLRKVCPERKFWMSYARLYYIGQQLRKCYSLFPILTSSCTRRSCDFRTNFLYKSICLNKYCSQYVLAICKGDNSYILQRIRIRYPCCCSCHHLYAFDSLAAPFSANNGGN